MKHKGFTVVELIVIIVVIAILASITIVSYTFIQEDAADTKIRTAVKNIGDAITLYESKSNTLAFSGTEAQLSSLESVLVPTYLSPTYKDGLRSKNAVGIGYGGWTDVVIYVYRCPVSVGGPGAFVVYASLNNPIATDESAYSSARSTCGPTLSSSPDITHRRQFKYAQFF